MSQIEVSAHVLRMLLARRPLWGEVFMLPMSQQPRFLRKTPESTKGSLRKRPQCIHQQAGGHRRRAILVSPEAWLQLQEDELFQEILRVFLHGCEVYVPL